MHDVAAAKASTCRASYAYSDSVTDIPMLDAVGHAVAVNPDRALAQLPREQGWEVRNFTNPVRLRTVDADPGTRPARGDSEGSC